MRIYAEANDQLQKDINLAVKEKCIVKTHIVLEALDQYLHGSDHGEPLILALANEDDDIRWAAAYALSKLNDTRAVERLKSALITKTKMSKRPLKRLSLNWNTRANSSSVCNLQDFISFFWPICLNKSR
jgi:HEAT repeat protein